MSSKHKSTPCLRTVAVRFGVALSALSIAVSAGAADARPPAPPPGDLGEFTLEQLLQLKITSVSKRPENWFASAAAVEVITAEDIQRSGVTTVADSLRAVPGLAVARLDSHTWAVSPRGFNSELASKLLVLMDGRSLYTPLNSGVWWDTVDTMLEDIDRIEVIRGPGGTLWGANAVNGVINVTTKHARDTQGTLANAGGGSLERAFGSVRYGGQINEHAWFRVYGRHAERGEFELATGGDAGDAWTHSQGGFRLDWEPAQGTQVTFQGDVYGGHRHQTRIESLPVDPYIAAVAHSDDVAGFNLLGRWTRQVGEGEMSLQTYYDDARRESSIPHEDRQMFDLDFQHRFPFGRRHEVVWGLGYRHMHDEVTGSFGTTLVPPERSTDVYSAFLQDEIALVPNRWRLTLGTKVEHNDYTGVEVQPNVRLAWTPNEHHTVWAAVSRAVRTPSRAEDDAQVLRAIAPGVPAYLAFLGSRAAGSEQLLAYELGYRTLPAPNLSFDVAAFYHDYDDLRTVMAGAPPYVLDPPLAVAGTFYSTGALMAESYGAEVAVGYQVADWWRLRGTYTFTRLRTRQEAGVGLPGLPSYEDMTPRNQFSVTSSFDLPGNVQLDGLLRYVDELALPGITSYFTLDVRVAWKLSPRVELAVVGQNLLEPEHVESSPQFTTFPTTAVPRSVYGKITFKF